MLLPCIPRVFHIYSTYVPRAFHVSSGHYFKLSNKAAVSILIGRFSNCMKRVFDKLPFIIDVTLCML